MTTFLLASAATSCASASARSVRRAPRSLSQKKVASAPNMNALTAVHMEKILPWPTAGGSGAAWLNNLSAVKFITLLSAIATSPAIVAQNQCCQSREPMPDCRRLHAPLKLASAVIAAVAPGGEETSFTTTPP